MIVVCEHGRTSGASISKPVAPRRFMNLDSDIQDNRNIQNNRNGNRMLPYSTAEASYLQSDGSYRKETCLHRPDEALHRSGEVLHRSEQTHHRSNETVHRSDEASCSTAEVSRSIAELLIQLNQGKLSSRPPLDTRSPSDNPPNGWAQDTVSYERNDSPHYRSNFAGSNSPGQSIRSPVQPPSFLSQNYAYYGPISSTTNVKPIIPQQTNHTNHTNDSYKSKPMVGEKRSATDMLKNQPKSPKIKIGTAGKSATSATTGGSKRFKPYHEDKWMENFQQLLKFKEENGNCLVPHTYLPNPLLARWVKRQRRQYKLCLERCPRSTMTPERIEILNKEGFVWDSHEITWMRKFYDLIDYRKVHGHCRVPSYSKDHPQLATWVKCQRRQFRLKREGGSSAMTAQRIKLLDDVGFSWDVRFAAPATNA